jgi:DNA-binding IclR family transcriptional regulator
LALLGLPRAGRARHSPLSRQTDLTGRAILDLLRREEQPMRPGEVAAKLGLGNNAAGGLLRSLASTGQVIVESSDRGTVYSPAPSA